MASTSNRFLLLAISIVLALGCSTISNITGPTPTPLAEGEIDLVSYISDVSGKNEIYILSLDRSFFLQVTDNNLEEKSLHWSPDGQKLIFTACHGSYCDLYLVGANGSNFTKLTNAEEDASSYSEPAWSPDSRQIAFVGEIESGKQIFLMDSDGSKIKQLTRDGLYNISPAWSPDGEHIAYSSTEQGDYDVFTIKSNGTDKFQITDNDLDDTNPIWSPDNSKIAYISKSNGNDLLYIVNSDATNPVDRSSGLKWIIDITWSPNSKAVGFSSLAPEGGLVTYTIGEALIDVSLIGQRTRDSYNNFSPSYAPDGERIVYYANMGEYSEVMVNHGSTGNPQQLTFDEAKIIDVAWVPIKARKPFVYEFPTATAVPTESLTDVYFMDDFSDPASGWKNGESSNGNASAEYSQGTYQVTIEIADTIYKIWREYRYADVQIEVDVMFDLSVSENNAGVVCRLKDNDTYYALRIAYRNDRGYYKISLRENAEWKDLMDWEESPTISQGTNHISASCIDNQITLSVNGRELVSIADNTIPEGKVGVYAGSWDDFPITITFDNFEAIPLP